MANRDSARMCWEIYDSAQEARYQLDDLMLKGRLSDQDEPTIERELDRNRSVFVWVITYTHFFD